VDAIIEFSRPIHNFSFKWHKLKIADFRVEYFCQAGGVPGWRFTVFGTWYVVRVCVCVTIISETTGDRGCLPRLQIGDNILDFRTVSDF